MNESINKILSDMITERAVLSATYKKVRRGAQPEIQFMKERGWKDNIINLFSKDLKTKKAFGLVLAKLNPDYEENTEQELKMAIHNLKELVSQGGDIKLIPYQKINGRDLRLEIIYRSDRINIDYDFEGQKIKPILVDFAKKCLDGLNVRASLNSKEVRVLDQKQYTQDKYTNSYSFDPFFNSIKFILKHRRQILLPSHFQITFSEAIDIKLSDRPQKQFWQDECKFQSKDNIEKLVNFICNREGADNFSRTSFLRDLTDQGIVTIEDVLKQKEIKTLLEKISKKKWACELEIQIQKIISPKVKEGFEKYLGKFNQQEYINCLKQGYTHKIFRYLFASIKGEGELGVHQLKKRIPYLNLSVVLRAIKIVKEELIMEDLFTQLEGYFKAFTFVAPLQKAPRYETPMGMLFYGPPGTGKTRLTEDLAQLMGFHLVENGLSSATFMKELVGEAKGMVQSYLSRARLSPHLICSIAIDEIDPLVLRRDSQSKNNTETISKFLSMMGGNEAVSNLLVLASTNHKLRIDEAIIRRFIPNIYVGLPNKDQRKKIVLSYLPKAAAYADFLVEITPNFSGAAIKELSQAIICVEQQKGQNLSNARLLEIVKRTAVNFNILFGEETYQNIYQSLQSGKKITLSLFEKFKQKVILFTNRNKSVTMTYGIEEDYFANEIKSCYQLCTSSIPVSTPIQFIILYSWLSEIFDDFIDCNSSLSSYKAALQNYQKPMLVGLEINRANLLREVLSISKNFKNLYICLYANQSGDIRQSQLQDIFANQLQLKEAPSALTGRILVNLAAKFPPKMEIERAFNPSQKLQVIIQPFISKEPVKRAYDALPEIVDYLVSNNISSIQMIDSNFFTRKGAYQEQQCLEVLKDVKEECTKYRRSGLIIYLDSIVMVNRSYSNSSTGISDSYSISQPQIYHNIINLLNNFSKVKEDEERWVILIVQEQELSKMVRKAIYWPLSAQELKSSDDKLKDEEKEKRKKQIRTCLYCKQKYTEEENEKSRTCMNHPGYFMNLNNCRQQQITLDIARFSQFQLNMNKEKEVKRYVYTCCWQYLDKEGCDKFHHFSGDPSQKDELSVKKATTTEQRKKKCQELGRIQSQNIRNARQQAYLPQNKKRN